ncbi:MAG: sigma-54-dependent Fis family transcriptional regulator [Planctomycetaceae bacterium]|nr:sigma-54-dependent Fis family transcriptional regulator [Planctomycetaceae bacterium]
MQESIVLLCRNPQHVADLAQALPASIKLHVAGSIGEIPERLHDSNATALISCFTEIRGGGHDEDALFETLQTTFPDVRLLAVVPKNCPEILLRRAACTDFSLLTDTDLVGEIVEWLTPTTQRTQSRPKTSAPANEPAPPDKPVATQAVDCQSVLNGITRKFETKTPRLRQMLSDLEVAAKHDVTTLLIGETGTGKTFLSRLIHEVSPRRAAPFLPVACGALPNDLIESEMFGHVKGAFTSAHADKDGKFIAAGRGTILLDEIDVLGPEQQVKLLRVIETGEFEPVGSVKTLKSQARIIVASNLDLEPLVEQGRFRPDLYYRLNMLKFDILPLRERLPDIESLARGFIIQQAEKHEVEISDVRDDLFEAVQKYPWPGNVRELENVIQRAVIYCDSGVLAARHLPSHILLDMAGPSSGTGVRRNRFEGSDRNSLGNQVATTERDIIAEMLVSNNQSRTKTAKALGISRVTLYNKMKKYGMSK